MSYKGHNCRLFSFHPLDNLDEIRTCYIMPVLYAFSTCIAQSGIYYLGMCNYGYIVHRLLADVAVLHTGSGGSTL